MPNGDTEETADFDPWEETEKTISLVDQMSAEEAALPGSIERALQLPRTTRDVTRAPGVPFPVAPPSALSPLTIPMPAQPRYDPTQDIIETAQRYNVPVETVITARQAGDVFSARESFKAAIDRGIPYDVALAQFGPRMIQPGRTTRMPTTPQQRIFETGGNRLVAYDPVTGQTRVVYQGPEKQKRDILLEKEITGILGEISKVRQNINEALTEKERLTYRGAMKYLEDKLASLREQYAKTTDQGSPSDQITEPIPEQAKRTPRVLIVPPGGTIPPEEARLPFGPAQPPISTAPAKPTSVSPRNPYQVGKRYGNFRYLGGDPNDRKNWKKLD